MSHSNTRTKEYETTHHLISRIAHRVYFLKDDERKDFLEIVRRTAQFSGVELLGWCVMGNHFHLFVFLPTPHFVDEQEVLERYGALKGSQAAASITAMFAEWRKQGETGEDRVSEWLDAQRRRMYDVGIFMKIVKQWFTMEYNRRNGHKGTLWESVYFDRVVPRFESEMAKCLAYIHLNPIRAAASDRFDGYAWSSYSAFRKGDPTATDGMRFVYGEEEPLDDIINRHELLMEELLEAEKLRRAEEIARKRAAGYEVPVDPLTTEAMVAQRASHLAEVQKASVELHEAQNLEKRRSARGALREKETLALLETCPEINAPMLSERLGVGIRMAYCILKALKDKGIIHQEGKLWRINIAKKV